MVAQLRDEDLAKVVEGPEGRSRGLVSCWAMPRKNTYDHKRHKQQLDASTGAPKGRPVLPTWDFLLTRDDGTAVRLHPQYKTYKVQSFQLADEAEPVEPPPTLGGSWGRGTYRYYKTLGAGPT